MVVLANLSQNQLETLRAFEREHGIKVLAFRDLPVDIELIPADQLLALRELEERLGVCLLAVR